MKNMYVDVLFVFNNQNANIGSEFGLEMYFCLLSLPVGRFENQ